MQNRILNYIWSLRIGRPVSIVQQGSLQLVTFLQPLTPFCAATIQRSKLRLIDWNAAEGWLLVAAPREWVMNGLLEKAAKFTDEVNAPRFLLDDYLKLFCVIRMVFSGFNAEHARLQRRLERARFVLAGRRQQARDLRMEVVRLEVENQRLRRALKNSTRWIGKPATTSEHKSELSDLRWAVAEALENMGGEF